MRYLLALDAGTGSGRAVVFDEHGNQIANSGREWVHLSEPDVPGSMNFDVEHNWQSLVNCIKDVLTKVKPAEIAAISTTSMREGIIAYDENGAEIWACANVDARANVEVKELRQKSDFFELDIYKQSGQTFALGAAPRLLWLKKNRFHLYQRIAKLSMLSDWIAYRLGAEIAVDPSNGGTSGLFNLRTRKWDTGIVSACGLDERLINTPVLEGGTIIGEVSAKTAQETGLIAGTPIIMGGGDAQLGAIGVGVIKTGETAILGGTFWQQMVNMSEPMVDQKGLIRINFAAMPDIWQAETIVFFPGLAVRWFRDAIAPDIKSQAISTGRDPYAVLEDMAMSVPAGSRNIIPILSDAMDYIRWRHAAPSFLNLNLDPEITNRASLFRALQENAAIVTRANLERIAEFTGISSETVTFAGGASKGHLWPQIVSDVLQKPLKIPVVKEATALGAAISAGVGIGIYTNFEEAAAHVVKIEKVIEPNPANAKAYQDLFFRWREAYPLQLELADRGVTFHMWRAPGE